MNQTQYNKMVKELEAIIIKYSDHLIEDHIKSATFTLANGFNVTFKDRKKKRSDDKIMTKKIKAKKFPEFVKCKCGGDMFKFTRVVKGSARFMCNKCSRTAEVVRQ